MRVLGFYRQTMIIRRQKRSCRKRDKAIKNRGDFSSKFCRVLSGFYNNGDVKISDKDHVNRIDLYSEVDEIDVTSGNKVKLAVGREGNNLCEMNLGVARRNQTTTDIVNSMSGSNNNNPLTFLADIHNSAKTPEPILISYYRIKQNAGFSDENGATAPSLVEQETFIMNAGLK